METFYGGFFFFHNMISLKLFNAVLSDGLSATNVTFVNDTLPLGYIIAPSASHQAKAIIAYYKKENLSGQQLNQTFHKSWEKIQKATRDELLAHQLLHYFTTYGFQALGIKSDFIYLPDEVCEVPELKKAPIRVIRAITTDEMANRCMGLLTSGVALSEETLRDVFTLLEQIGRVPTSAKGIVNREAQVMLADKFGVYPEHPSDFMRFLVFKATNSTLLIKDKKTIGLVAGSKFDLRPYVTAFGADRCAEVFNRFKPLWLAFKKNPVNVPVVNLISRLSKTHHKPLPMDYLNTVTAQKNIDLKELKQALKSANQFRKIRLLYALSTRITEAEYLLYRIRNGKSFTTPIVITGHKLRQWAEAYRIVADDIATTMNVSGKTFLMNPNVQLAIPASEKMFIGNLPCGTTVHQKESITVGIYWRNEWGAMDLDLSAISLEKVGWNSHYASTGVTYSGDMTDARNGATELLRFSNEDRGSYVVMMNTYSGGEEAEYKIIVGDSPDVGKNYMFSPDELFMEVKTTTDQKQQVLGMVFPSRFGYKFVLANFGAGDSRISNTDPNSSALRKALVAQWGEAPMLHHILARGGANVVTDPSLVEGTEYVDLRWENLSKDTILDLFK